MGKSSRLIDGSSRLSRLGMDAWECLLDNN